MTRFPRHLAVRLACAVATCAGLALQLPSLSAQEAPPAKKPKSDPPILIVTAASVNRLLEDADFMFAESERPELSEMIGGVLANVRDLKGLNRDQSMGMMLFLSGIVPQPVVFVPVDSIDDLLQTVTFGPVTTSKLSETRFEIKTGQQTLQVLMHDGYAFVANTADMLDRDFSNPAQLTRRLTTSYDLAASINLTSLPKVTRDLFLDFLRASSEAQLQQRDNEPDSAFRIRKAGGTRNIEAIERLVTDGEELTIGWNVSKENKEAVLEVVLTADPKSEFAVLLNTLSEARSYFANLLREETPLTISSALTIDKLDRKFLSELVKAAETEVTANLPQGAGEATTAAANLQDLFTSIQASIQTGKLDFAMQFLGEPPGPFVLVGGVRVTDGEKLSKGLTEIFGRLQTNPNLESVQLNAAEHRGVRLHRIQGKGVREQDLRIYGAAPAIYVGAGPEAMWFALGGDEALPKLKKAIDTTAEPPVNEARVSPFQVVLHLASWIGMIDDDEGDNPFPELARAAFAQGNDTFRIEIRPLEDGMRFRMRFDAGFVRLLGLSIARGIDDSQN